MPFVQTALLDDRGAARTSGSSGEFINHYTGVRIRVVGAGVLRPTLRGQDAIETSTLPTITMAATDSRSKFVLSNFVTQRAQLKLETTAIDETFRINRIIILAKPIFTEEPA